jgi:hypothetical protein
MAVPKTAALPLGYTPISENESAHLNQIVRGGYKKKPLRARNNIILFTYEKII